MQPPESLPEQETLVDAPKSTSTDQPDKQIGPYRLIDRLGVGGMGQVWLAEQTEPVKRRVALKLIKAGLYDDAVTQRFLSERQSLAMMEHPAIAKVFDAGATAAGQPYLAMEYVDGLPLTDYCDQKRLSVRDRLKLFLQVCEGVQHAHQKAIIHRDLKPSNILVTEVDGKPTPRIIDFGLAKLTAPTVPGETMFTQHGAYLGTPGYMSPEQADPAVEDIDTRTDVYSLGVILYELLTGELPFDTKRWKNQRIDQILQQLRERSPDRPSTKALANKDTTSSRAEVRGTDPGALASSLHGDLDVITLKALEPDRSRRYGGPFELAADIERYLENRPVLARPASAGYRLRKYLQRNRVAVSVTALAALLFIAFALVQAIQLRRTTRERDRADRVAEFMTQMFAVSDPSEARGNSITAREILDRSSSEIDKSLGQDPELRSSMTFLMARVYRGLGLYAKSQSLIEKTIETDGRTFGESDVRTLRAKSVLATDLAAQGQFAAGEKLARETALQATALLGPRNADTLKARSTLATILEIEGRSPEAVGIYREILETGRSVLGANNIDTADYAYGLAGSSSNLGRYPEAEDLYHQVIDMYTKAYGSDHPRTILAMHNLANTLSDSGRPAEAEKVARQVVDAERRVLGADHPETLGAESNLANYISDQGRYAESVGLYRDILSTQKRVSGPDSPETLLTMDNLANSLGQLGEFAEAETLEKDALERMGRVYGAHSSIRANSAYDLACIYALQGKHEDALSYLEQATQIGLDVHSGLHIAQDEDLKSLHGDPRFDRLAEEVQRQALQAQKKN